MHKDELSILHLSKFNILEELEDTSGMDPNGFPFYKNRSDSLCFFLYKATS